MDVDIVITLRGYK